MAGLFAEAVAGRLELARLSKATLTELSHVLENMLIEFDLPATVLTGFQVSRNWEAELARYERLVSPAARRVAVFASGNLGDTGNVLGFRLDEDSRLTQEWFIIVLCDEFSVALFGEDNPRDVPPHEEMDRVFDAAWTFDPAIVTDLCDVLMREVRRDHPERAAEVAAAMQLHPPRVASSVFEQRFNRRVFEAMEVGRRRWRRELVRSQDIHDRLQRANEHLLRLERLAAIGTTAATLAHELNNPLASITMSAELMAMKSEANTLEAGDVERHTHNITMMASRAGKMTRGMLDLVRVHDATIEPLRLSSWLDRFADEMTQATHRTVLAHCGPDVVVMADADRLRHILTNLVNNGLHASDADRPVVVDVSVSATHATIAVRDQGHGIPESVHTSMFQPFTTTKAAQGGTGLGLALAKRFAEDQHSALTLAGTGPDGTVFHLVMPLASPTAPRADQPGESPAEPTDERRVLVVDDDPDVRALLAHLLRQSGWQVWVAGDTEEAVDEATSRHFDAVLVDFRLSDGNSAVDVLDRIDAALPGLRSRSIVITGSLTRELPDELPPVLLKPFSRAELQAAIEQRLRSLGS